MVTMGLRADGVPKFGGKNSPANGSLSFIDYLHLPIHSEENSIHVKVHFSIFF